MRAVASSKWSVFAGCYVSILGIGMCFTSMPPLQRYIVAELALSQEQIGKLIGAFAVVAIALSVPVGLGLRAMGIRAAMAAGFLFFVGGLALSASSWNFTSLWLGRVIAGGGGTVITISVMEALYRVFEARMSLALGLLNTAFPVGATLSYNLFPRLGAEIGWRATLYITLGYVVLSALFFFRGYSEAAETDTIIRNRGQRRGLDRHFVVCCAGLSVIWLLSNAGIFCYATFASRYFEAVGLSEHVSSRLQGLAFTLSIPVSPLIGWLLIRRPWKLSVLCLTFAGMAASIWVLPESPSWILPLAVAVGVGNAIPPVCILALPADWFHHRRQALAFACINTGFGLGVSFIPGLVGRVFDETNSYTAQFHSIAALYAVAGGLTLALWIWTSLLQPDLMENEPAPAR